MKKAICFFLLVAMALCIAACGGGEKVTVYLPATMTMRMGDGTSEGEAVYEFEKDWQKKETFKMTVVATVEGQTANVMETVYSDKCVQSTLTGVTQTTNRYDENGNSISCTTVYEYENTKVSKLETTYTYDENGLLLRVNEITYNKDGSTRTEETTYTSTETADGYTCVGQYHTLTLTSYFDKNLRKVKSTTVEDGEIRNQTDIIYDDVNYTMEQKDYYQGQLSSSMVTTYKAVEVAPEVAARIPHFVGTFVKQ